MADVSIIVDKNGTEFAIADMAARAGVASAETKIGDADKIARFVTTNTAVSEETPVKMFNSPSTGWLFQMNVSLRGQTAQGVFANAKSITFGIDATGGIYVYGVNEKGQVIATKRIFWSE